MKVFEIRTAKSSMGVWQKLLLEREREREREKRSAQRRGFTLPREDRVPAYAFHTQSGAHTHKVLETKRETHTHTAHSQRAVWPSALQPTHPTKGLLRKVGLALCSFISVISQTPYLKRSIVQERALGNDVGFFSPNTLSKIDSYRPLRHMGRGASRGERASAQRRPSTGPTGRRSSSAAERRHETSAPWTPRTPRAPRPRAQPQMRPRRTRQAPTPRVDRTAAFFSLSLSLSLSLSRF